MGSHHAPAPADAPALAALRAALRQLPLAAVGDAFPGLFCLADRDGALLLWNERLLRLSGLDAPALACTTLPELFRPEQRAHVAATMACAFNDEHIASLETTLTAPHGPAQHYLLSLVKVSHDALDYLCAFGIDITARYLQEQQLRLHERALHAAGSGVIITRCEGNDNPIEYINPAFERITGYGPDETVGRDARFMAAPDFDAVQRMRLREAILERREETVVFRNLRKDGTLFWSELSITPVAAEFGNVTHYIGIINDITEYKQRTSSLEQRLNHDPLTGLVNRNLLWDRLEQAMNQAQRNKTMVATILVDLNKFKQINDTYGHEAGDVVLTAVARRMQHAVRDTDTVARLSGDEFVLVLANQPSLRYTMRMIDRLYDNLSRPVSFSDSEIAVGASLGVSIYPHDAEAPLDLVKAADTAMYQAKSGNGGHVHFYSADMKSNAETKRQRAFELQAALENEEFFLLYQPRQGALGGAIPAVEGLLRWRHPQRGVLTPAAFMADVTDNDIIGPLGERMLDLALRFMTELRDAGHADLMVALPIGCRELSQDNCITRLGQRLAELGLATHRLQLEISERSVVSDAELMRTIAGQMHECGIRLAIDEAGDGMTSLGTLADLRASHLKIHRRAVDAISHHGHESALIRALIELGHSLDMVTVGDGVETATQAAFLRAQGCDELQGNYISHPLAATPLLHLLRRPPTRP